MYKLIKANKKDRDKLFQYKLKLTKVSNKETSKILNKDVKRKRKNYQMIIYNDEIIGCLLLERNQINEIYIEEEYRNKLIGTNIINDIILKNKETYLWVYKDNRKAIELYKRLGFKVIKKTEQSYYMRRV